MQPIKFLIGRILIGPWDRSREIGVRDQELSPSLSLSIQSRKFLIGRILIGPWDRSREIGVRDQELSPSLSLSLLS